MLAVLGAACGKADVRSPGSGGRSTPQGAGDLILRMSTEGGFTPEDYTLRQIPEFSLMGDGRVFTLGAQIEIYPPPALPPLLVRPVEDDAVATIIAEAEAAGLDGPDKNYDYAGVADAGTTVFTYVDAAGATHKISAYALGFEADGMAPGPDGRPMSEQDREARAKLAKLRDKLMDLSSWLPRESLGEDKVYEIEKLRVFAKDYAVNNTEEPKQPAKEWPLTTPIATFGESWGDGRYRCGVIEGADLQAAESDLKSSNQATPWTSAGKQHQLILRPLLPDETGCPK